MSRCALLWFVIAACGTSVPAAAGPPYPWNCTIDTTLVLCPAGDVAFRGVIRRSAPVWGSHVEFDASAVRILPAHDGSYTIQQGRPATLTGMDGRFTMSLRGGGVSAAPVWVMADGMWIRERVIASFDQDGDLLVGSADEALVLAKLGGGDRTADFDGDLVVTEADLAAVRAHRGHAAETPTASAVGTWGRVKAIYR